MTSESSKDALPVEQLNQYRLIRLVGRGPGSALYEAHDVELNRKVAIKLLDKNVAQELLEAQRFFSQAAAAAKILHPNIIRMYYVGQDGPHCYCAREFVDGSSLEERVSYAEPFTERSALNVVEQILEGLEAAESRGMSHGNLHARNVLLDRTGSRVLLSDFQAARPDGVGRATATSTSSEHLVISPDLASVGLLLRRMLGIALDRGPVAPPSAGLQAILDRLSSGGRFPPFNSAMEALAAVQLWNERNAAVDGPEPSLAGRTSAPLTAPQSGDAAVFELQALGSDPELPEGVFETAQSSHWRQWIMRRLGLVAPENPQRIKDTQAAVDGVLIAMQRRLQDLNRLALDGENILRDLQQQASQHLKSETDRQDLATSISAQQKQLDEIQVRQSDLTRKVRDLTRQRDALHARLVAAELRGARTDQPNPAKGSSKKLALAAQILLVVGLFSFAGYLAIQAVDFKQLRNRAIAHVENLKRAAAVPVARSIPVAANYSWIPAELTAVPLRMLRAAGKHGVVTVSFCRGRSIVAGGSTDGVMRVWSVESGMEINRSVHQILGSTTDITAAVFHPNGRHVAISFQGRGSCLMLWDLSTGEIVTRMQGVMQMVKSMSFTPDGKFLAAVVKEEVPDNPSLPFGKGVVVVYDTKTGQLVEKIPAGEIVVTHVACSPVGSLIAFMGAGHPIQVWDTKQRRIVHRLTGCEAQPGCLAFSPDGRQLAAGEAMGGISVWALGKDDRPLHLARKAPTPSRVSGVAFSPDGRILAGIGGGFASLWDLSRQQVIRYLMAGHEHLEFSDDGRFLVTTGNDSSTYPWEVDPVTKVVRRREANPTPPLVWDTSDLGSLLRPPQSRKGNKSSGSSTTTAAGAAVSAVRNLHYLQVTDQDRPVEWQTSLKAAAPSFPQVEADVDESPARWQEVMLNTSKAGFDAIRFTSPLNTPADLHWSFNLPKGVVGWKIDSPAGPIQNFRTFRYEHNLRVPEVPVSDFNVFYFQSYEGGQILPGREYVIWFNFLSQDPGPIRLALHLRKSQAGVTSDNYPDRSSQEIMQAMGWSFPLQYSGIMQSQMDMVFIRPRDPFDFQPRLPFSQERYRSVQVRRYQLYEE